MIIPISRVTVSRWWCAYLCATIGIVLGVFSLLMSHSTVSAHATLIETSPTDGELSETQPEKVTLTFTEPVQIAEDGVSLVDSEGETSTLDAVSVNSTVEAALPTDLTEGTHVVSWRVISLDGHPINGAFTFSIGAASDAPVTIPEEQDDRTVDILHDINQGIGYLSLFAASGLIIFDRFILTRAADAPRQGSRLALIAAMLAVLSYLLAIPLSYVRQQGLDLFGILEFSQWSPLLEEAEGLSLLAVVIGLGGALFIAPSFGPTAIQRWRTLLFLAIALASVALTGHTRAYEPAWLIIASDLVHVANGAIWFGGLLGLTLFLRRATPAATAATVIARFSALAGWLVLLLGISGIVLGWIILDSPSDLIDTNYGRILLVKVALVGIAGLIAAWNHFRLRPAIEQAPAEANRWRMLRRFVIAEASVLAAVLLITGFLVNQSPTDAAENEPPQTTAPATIQFDAALGDGTIQGQIVPGGTGTNTLTLELLDADGNPLEPVDDPQVSLSLPAEDLGPLEPALTPTDEPGVYQASISLPRPGEWEMEATVRVSQFEEARSNLSITVP